MAPASHDIARTLHPAETRPGNGDDRRRRCRDRRSFGAAENRFAATWLGPVSASYRTREHCYYARLCGLDRDDIADRVEEIIKTLDIGDFADRRGKGFSHGQRTKTALGRALVHDPQNLILDEPTPDSTSWPPAALRELIVRLKAEGRCVLFSSHVMQEVAGPLRRHLHHRPRQDRNSRLGRRNSERTGREDLEDAFVAAIAMVGDE